MLASAARALVRQMKSAVRVSVLAGGLRRLGGDRVSSQLPQLPSKKGSHRRRTKRNYFIERRREFWLLDWWADKNCHVRGWEEAQCPPLWWPLDQRCKRRCVLRVGSPEWQSDLCRLNDEGRHRDDNNRGRAMHGCDSSSAVGWLENARSSGLCDARLEPCACRKPKSGRIGNAARQAGRATRCARFRECEECDARSGLLWRHNAAGLAKECGLTLQPFFLHGVVL